MAENTPGSITPKNWFFGIIAVVIVIIIAGTAIVLFKSGSKTVTENKKIEKTVNKSAEDIVDYDNAVKKENTDDANSLKTKNLNAAGESEAQRLARINAYVKVEGKIIYIHDFIVQQINGGLYPDLPVYASGGEYFKGKLSANGWLNGKLKQIWSKYEIKKEPKSEFWYIDMTALDNVMFNIAQYHDGEAYYVDLGQYEGAWWLYDNRVNTGRIALAPLPGYQPESH